MVRGLGKARALRLDVRLQVTLASQFGFQTQILLTQNLFTLAHILVKGAPA